VGLVGNNERIIYLTEFILLVQKMNHISPITQYYLRKLLNQGLGTDSDTLGFTSSKILEGIQNKLLQTSSVRELEILVNHYQNVESQLTQHQENLAEVKRRIFRVLGLRLNSLVSSTVPTSVQESASTSFHFLQQGKLLEGVRFESEVYGLIKQFNLVQRQQAYQVAWALTEQKVPFILTASEARYGIWVCLRSPTYTVLINQGLGILDRVVSLQSILNSFKETTYIPV
jgi:hypothetical protein